MQCSRPPPVIQRLAAGVRRLWPGVLKFHFLLCGIPVQGCCDSQLAIAEGADLGAILAGLDEVAIDLARKSGCRVLSFMQFKPELAAQLDGLSQHGFHKSRSVYAYQLEGALDSFATYTAQRSKRTRANMRKSLKRFDEAGLTCEQIRGRDGAERLFTPEVYQLYLNVLERAKDRFERLPVSFFQELARQFPDESCYTILRQGERVVAFCCGLAGGDQHLMLYCGLDYSLSRDIDLYFNVIYRGLECGLVPGVRVVHVGASADEFKQHMGCRGSWLSVYLKAVYPLGRFLLNCLSGLLFDTRDSTNAPPPAGTVRVESAVVTAQAEGEAVVDSNNPGAIPKRRNDIVPSVGPLGPHGMGARRQSEACRSDSE